MAEVFGVVTGAAGLVSLAVQTAEKIKSAKDFLDRVREAPQEVKLVRDEVEALTYVLDDIQFRLNNQNTYSPGNTLAVEHSLRLCRTAGEQLEVLARKLHENIIRRKRTGKAKAALKEDDLSKFRSRLRDAKSTLSLANQCYYAAINENYHMAQMRSLGELQNAQIQIFSAIESSKITTSQVSNRPQLPHREDNALETMESTDDVIFNTREASLKRANAGSLTSHAVYHYLFGTTVAYVRPPLWLLRRQYMIRARKSYSGWDFSPRSYVVIPYLNPVFDICRGGRVNDLQKMLQSGSATPFSCDEFGETLLHCAARHGRYDVIQLLLQCGADPHVKDGMSRTPLFLFTEDAWLISSLRRNHDLEDEYQATLRCLAKTGCDLADLELVPGLRDRLVYNGPLSSLSWLLDKAISNGTVSENRPKWSLIFFTLVRPSVDFVRAALPGSKKLHQVLLDNIPDDWKSLAQNAIRAGADLHAQNSDGLTPFLRLLQDQWGDRGYISRRQRRKILNFWLSMLKEEGIELKTYAQCEMETWDPIVLTLLGVSEIQIHQRGWVEISWLFNLDDPSIKYDTVHNIFKENRPTSWDRYRVVQHGTLKSFLTLCGDGEDRDVSKGWRCFAS
ncbi:hypothetical protein F5884DRAFT_901718 [Xylogone sp. PMI_703]|nr:hypothetical protein F5884DRAFT_901718 [Xylogone sp. PMI_703]